MAAPENRKQLDEVFAAAMREAWMKTPEDPEISVAYAESLMIQHPHDYWSEQVSRSDSRSRSSQSSEQPWWIGHRTRGRTITTFLRWRAPRTPMRGWRSSSLLQELVPGSGHLVHIASHIFLRLGHYACGGVSALWKPIGQCMDKPPTSDSYRLQMLRYCAALADAAMMEARLETAIDACRRIDASRMRPSASDACNRLTASRRQDFRCSCGLERGTKSSLSPKFHKNS